MNLLFITTKKTWGGSELLWCDATALAIAEGHKVTIVMPQAEETHARVNDLVGRGAALVLRPTRATPSIFLKLKWKLFGIKQPETQWWRDHFPEPPDAICVSQGGTYCAINMPGLVFWLLETDAPFILVSNSHRTYALPDCCYREDLKKLFRKSSRVCFVAEEHIPAASRFLGVKLPQAIVVQNPVNLNEGISKSDGLERKANVAGKMACVGRFEVRDKGQDLLLEALSGEVWRSRDFRLDFYGSGPDREILEDLIRLYGLGDKVRVAGYESDIAKLWREHDLLVLPSLSEGTPLTLIEAQLCGRPSLVTRVDGCPDWVEEGKTGFIAEAPTVRHLREALERAWANRQRWEEMGEAARESCLAKRDPDPAGTLLALMLAAERPIADGSRSAAQTA